MKSLSNEDFIERARKIHKNKYNYSKVEYKNYNTKVCIICPEHGEFWQAPRLHLIGRGCKKCADRKKSENNEYFINMARKIHGDKYDYSKVKYINNKTPVCIICPEHGEFWQSLIAHVSNKHNCPECSKRKRYTEEEWIEKANKIHNNKYDYAKTKFVDARKKVIITCPIHGDFQQAAHSHLEGYGCSKCRDEENHKKQKNQGKIL